MKVRYFEKRGEYWLDFKMPDGSRKRVPSGCSTLKQAEAASTAIVASYLSKRPTTSTVQPVASSSASNGPCGLTLQQAFDKGMKERESWVDSKSKESLRGNFKALTSTSKLLHADMDCSVMTRDLMMALRAEWKEQPGLRPGTTTSNSTINHRLVMASTLLEIANLPPHTVKGLSVTNNRRMRRVSENELQAVQSWLYSQHHRKGATTMADLVLVGLNTTARMSELLNLTWADVHLEEGYMVVRNTKNGDSRHGALTDVSKRVLERRLGYGGTGPFTDLGKPQAEQLWRDARKAIGLEEDREFVFHVATRHEGLSRLADSGESAYVVQAFGGHKSIASSARYVKPSMATLQAAGAAISPKMDAPKGGTDA